MPRSRPAFLVICVVAGLAAPAVARQNTNVTPADIRRLQDNAFDAASDVAALRGRDAERADTLQTELDALREEVIYLKVKLRKEGTLLRAEYADVRDRIEDLRTRARGSETRSARVAGARLGAPDDARPASATPGDTATIAAGTEVDVRLSVGLDSGEAQVEDRFEATTLIDINVDGRRVVPAGSVMRGVVADVEPATRTNRTARMTVTFDQVTVDGQPYPMRGTVTQAIEGEGLKGEAGRIGTGAGVGAVLGGILGGFKGTLAGILIGAGGTIAATEGRQVELPQGSVLRVRIDAPLEIATR